MVLLKIIYITSVFIDLAKINVQGLLGVFSQTLFYETRSKPLLYNTDKGVYMKLIDAFGNIRSWLIVKALQHDAVTSIEQIDEVFEKVHIRSLLSRIYYLQKASGGRAVERHSSPSYKALTMDEQYQWEQKIFLTKAWKKTENYKKFLRRNK